MAGSELDDDHPAHPAPSTPDKVRLATPADAAELVRLRRVMFESMDVDTSDDAWEAVALDHFAREIAAGRLVAVVVDAPDGSGGLAACGAVQFDHRLPGPGRASTQRGYLSSMSTDPRWRRRGYAQAIVVRLLEICVERGISLVTLHATEEGRFVYERHGFEVRERYPEMRWAAEQRAATAPPPPPPAPHDTGGR